MDLRAILNSECNSAKCKPKGGKLWIIELDLHKVKFAVKLSSKHVWKISEEFKCASTSMCTM